MDKGSTSMEVERKKEGVIECTLCQESMDALNANHGDGGEDDDKL